ncbi:tail fiber domain-containing protein [Roseovarius nitratireducens]|uniref:tail fiber domain-containing protein n=1 Tax=Roseovarius nitratireducens TaxID=2044597 RepID=UPI000CE19C21|nr:tail fiber domain-containing protein [Roseovarius nitratireducens]
MGIYGGGSAPSPDPKIGEAAMKSAEIGEDYLGFMREQAKISNKWAEDDRSRYKSVFEPLQDQYINEALQGPDYDEVAGSVRRAGADARRQFSLAQGQEERRLAASGVDPASGRSREATRRSELTEALGVAGARNTTRITERARAEDRADAETANAINMGSGLAVNPATSLGISNSANSSGFRGAMQGYGQQGQLLNTQYQQQLQSWQADQASSNSMWGGIGSLAGLGISMMSSKDYKEDKRPARGVLDTLKGMPVEEWTYKKGIADEGRHIGPYAEDFHSATGKGDGKSIPFQDALGVTMGAVQELADKVDKLEGGKTRRKRPGGRGVMDTAPREASGSGPEPRSIAGAA